MKFFFDKAFYLLALIILSIIFFSSCSKKKSTGGEAVNNSLAQTYANSQNEQKKEAASFVERVSYNKCIAVTDKGNKSFTEVKAIDLVKEMKAGWNLGNTFDATGGDNSLQSEISWGQPYTTKAMIDGLAASGIQTVRIPVSWSHHIIDADYTIDPAWMTRVKEVVDWAIDDGLYVILNIHHDNYARDEKMPPLSGFYPTEENYENSANFVCNVWAQIALAFNNGYDQHLIFEVLNEPRLCGTEEEWYYNPASKKSYNAMKILNKLNQGILDTIRASGGNNKNRLVAFPSLQASPDSAFSSAFKMPQDYDARNHRLILSVHMYTPYSFAMESPGIREYSDSVKREFTSIFKRLDEQYISKGYAVYIGEYGATNKNNLKDRVAWFHDFIKEAGAYGMPCILWDNGIWEVEGQAYDEHYGFYNRSEQSWYFPDILNAIIGGINEL